MVFTEPRRNSRVCASACPLLVSAFVPAYPMTEMELEQLLIHLTAALDVFRSHKGPLAAPDISIKSMLNVARLQVSDELAAARIKGSRGPV